MTIKIGIAGAGEWAARVHIPSILADPRFQISGVWARRSERATLIANQFGIKPVDSFDELVLASDVVDFAVPPAAQPELALKAAKHGKHLIMEKPVGVDLELLGRLNAEVQLQDLHVAVFVTRFFDRGRVAIMRDLAEQEWTRARSEWRSNAYSPGSPFATHWREAHGLLYDIGPHSISQLESILGPVQRGVVTSRAPTTATLTLHHESGTVSDVFIDVGANVSALEERLVLWGPCGSLEPALPQVEPRSAFATMLSNLAADIRRGPNEKPVTPREASLTEGIRMVRLLELLSSTGE